MQGSFEKFANIIARAMGRPLTFTVCCLLVLIWAATGPLFHFSDTWQLVINTGTTIVTFLMVFLIQNSQNREGAALQGKLDELIRALETAENRYIGLERRTDREIMEMRTQCEAVLDEATAERPADSALEKQGMAETTSIPPIPAAL
jgi:low affinity Fe/Cu permease